MDSFNAKHLSAIGSIPFWNNSILTNNALPAILPKDYAMRTPGDWGGSALLNVLVRQKYMAMSQIFSIPSDVYRLKMPISVVLEYENNEVTASIPDLEIYGEGNSDTEALSDLKFELLDLIDIVFDEPDEKLGESPKMWKKSLQMVVEKCQ
jgi:hypothetical protein